MKEKFKKAIIMTREPQRKAFAEAMQALGLLHIEQEIMEFPEEAEDLVHERNHLLRLMSFVESEAANEPDCESTSVDFSKLSEVMEELKEIEARWDELHRKLEKSMKEAVRLAPWGNYDFNNFRPLLAQGLQVYLGQADKKNMHLLASTENVVEVIKETGNVRYFVWIGFSAPENSQIDYFPLPERSPEQIEREIIILKEEIKTCRSSLAKYRKVLPLLKMHRQQMDDAIRLLQVEANFQQNFEGKFISTTAWFPVSNERQVRSFLEREQWAWEIEEASAEDDVPVLLKNRKYPKLFEPITQIFELPNYYEADLTPFLAVFYPILFAYCLGDAGYGFVLTAAMVFGYFTFFRNNRAAAVLGFILGAVTTIMGFIKSGSLFGIMLLPDHENNWIRELSAWVIIPDDSSVAFNAFNVALMIGVIQIITGILISIYNSIHYQSWNKALMPTGKLLIVSSLIWIFLGDMQQVSFFQNGETLRRILLIFGVLLVTFFHDLEISIPKRIGSAFMPLFFIFTGILGDVLSYVRLFALGLASSVLGLVVNQIGMQIMEGGVFSVVVGVVFLLFGHTLNFGIAALGSFVHPLRLTFVEFYGNVGFQGKGVPYQPLMKTKQESP